MNSQSKRYENQFDPLLGVPENSPEPASIKTGPLQTPLSPISRLFDVSGLYTWKSSPPTILPDTAVLTPSPNLNFAWGIGYEALRLDVDGHYPQMVASGTIKNLFHTVHWQATVEPINHNTWVGVIYDKKGAKALFPFTAVQITAIRSMFHNQRKLNVTFLGDNLPERHTILKFESPYFQKISLTLDFATSPPTPVTNAATICPPVRRVTMAELFQEAGFDITITARELLSDTEAVKTTYWHDQELHDAMQFYWANCPETVDPSLWVLFAHLHQTGPQVGATIYDDIGPGHAQGTAVFTNSFIAQSPDDIAEPADWLRFGLICRQIGTALNPPGSELPSLVHSQLPSFPAVAGYLSDCFSPATLRTMRHAIISHNATGTADWYDEHGFDTPSCPSLQLELGLNREWPIFEFMEPVILQLKLTNLSPYPQWVDQTALTSQNHLTLILKRDDQPARPFLPYKRDYQLPQPHQIMPNHSLYGSLFISADCNGWQITEPGSYTIHAALTLADKMILSNRLRIRVLAPSLFTEEYLAQDFFTDDVGRILAFNGSRFFQSGNQVLREIMACLPQQRVALHAANALGQVLMHDYKRLVLAPGAAPQHLQLITQPGRVDEARQLLNIALSRDASTAAATFGHIRWRIYMEQFSLWLTQQGEPQMAAQTVERLNRTMADHHMNGRQTSFPP